MFIYEVNIEVQPEIFADYYAWLVPHVEEVLTFPGFIDASIQQDTTAANHITIIYRIDTQAHLDNYLKEHAPKMRDDGIKRFPNQFKANRRIRSTLWPCEHNKS